MSRLAKSFALFLSFVGLLLGATNANALACTSVATGNWGVAGTWTSAGNCNRVPTAADTVTIATGHTITVNVATANVLSVTVNTGAILTQTQALSTAGVLSVAGTLTSNNAMTVTGATTVTGNLNIVGAGARTFTGLVTVTGGTWNNSGNRAVTFRGGITNNGTFTAGTGTQTFNLAQAIGGANPINFGGIVAVAGAITVTNNNTNIVTITGNLTGSVAGSTWVNAANSTLNYMGAAAPMGTRVFTANASPNTVNYNRAGAQTVKAPSGAPATYYNLTLSGSGAKTMPATAMTVAGNFAMSGTAATSATAAQALTVGGNFTINALNTFTAGAFLHSVGGNWSNSGTFTAGTSTVTFTGTNSTLGGSVATTFNNLTINKAAGNNVSIVCAAPSPTVNVTLALTSGDIVTAGTSPGCATTCASQVPIIVAAAGTITGGSSTSYVQGALRKLFNAAATLNFRAVAGQDEFPVGDAANYTPIEITAGTTSTAGSVTACVTPTDHPQVTTPVATTGIDAAKSVNRYWSLTTATINTTAAPVDATFKFVAGDVDAGATTANFIVENYGTYWRPTTLVAAGATSTRASNIDLTSAVSTNNNIAIGEPLFGFTAVPGLYNAFETATTAGAILGKIQTKVAGSGFSVDIVHINATKTGVLAGAITVEVRLLDSSGGGALDVNGCNAAWPLIQALPNFAIPASGRGTIPAATVANSYRSVRFQIRSPVGGPYTQIGCSTDLFAIRPASLTVSAWDATWATAGTSRQLNNIGASGGNVHKAATSANPLPFTLRATPLPATATNYDGNPTTVATFPTCGGLCTTAGALSFTAGSWTAAGLGVRENATANYTEAGTFNLQLEDATYASVDAVDGTPAATLTVPSASVEIGRFVPDHFALTGGSMTNRAVAACASASTFTYAGEKFRAALTLTAQNASNSTTSNYPIAATEFDGAVPTNYGFGAIDLADAIPPIAATPNLNLDIASATSSGSWTAGVGTFTADLSLTRAATPDGPYESFNLGVAPTDADGVTLATYNLDINNDAINDHGLVAASKVRFGRLKLSNAYGSELLGLPIPIQTQYWNSTAFVTNSSDNCTSLTTSNIKLTAVAGVTATMPAGGTFISGVGSLTLTKPTVPAKVAVNVCVDLGADPGGGTVCSAITSASMSYLQGLWAPGSNYNNDPTAQATFGTYKGANEFIYLRENY